MMKKFFTKDGRDFVVAFNEDKKQVFVGTVGFVSNIAAQMICHQLMAPLRWKSSKSWRDLKDSNGNTCIAVGYKIPFWVSPKRAEALITSLFD